MATPSSQTAKVKYAEWLEAQGRPEAPTWRWLATENKYPTRESKFATYSWCHALPRELFNSLTSDVEYSGLAYIWKAYPDISAAFDAVVSAHLEDA